jgi:hypothetical protein
MEVVDFFMDGDDVILAIQDCSENTTIHVEITMTKEELEKLREIINKEPPQLSPPLKIT